MYFKEHI